MKQSFLSVRFLGIASRIVTPLTIRNSERSTPSVSVMALWDTGSSKCLISESKSKIIGANFTRRVPIKTAIGESTLDAGVIAVELCRDGQSFIATAAVVPDEALNGVDFVVGMDIISFGEFHLVVKDGETAFTFIAPAVASPGLISDPSKFQMAFRNACFDEKEEFDCECFECELQKKTSNT